MILVDRESFFDVQFKSFFWVSVRSFFFYSSFLVLFCCCFLFGCLLLLFFVKYLVCANRLTCSEVSQDYLGAGERKIVGSLWRLCLQSYKRNILNKPVYPKQ